ncbi:tripartite tricarboxylate transporter substrate-binding protein [Variovorax sp. J22P240]|uniref:Bug family tripartite tricarboxylate transporter substrate binding protein n=1 Tax=Variovorax sp. J22P240 TaxID=3053514 RepID=UPI0025750503|nr:tripartite tricarboxylate transporter substrate-binding protein [Variovorax sp. J22P240]MDM0001176.1 tripartite tricarboxylate transporter substrate-binding protein [Variovorax sp. J22P240]
MNTGRRSFSLAALAAAGLGAAGAAVAQAQPAPWPTRPLKIVAGGVGSVTDIRARWLAERLGSAFGHPVIVENNAAAGGNIGAAAVAHSAPDGYTLLLIHQGTAAFNPYLFARTGYDPLADFAPITRWGHGSLLLTVAPGVPVNSVRELVALAKTKPGALNFASPGVGTPPHLASELFKRAAGIDAVHVPYKGGGAMMGALLAGQVTWVIEGLTAQLPHVRTGSLRALGVTGATRSPSLPEVPTIAEAGVGGYEFAGWTGIAAPANTPRPVVDRIHTEIARVSSTDEARAWFASGGAEPGLMTPEAFGEFIRSENMRWGQVIREAGIRME